VRKSARRRPPRRREGGADEAAERRDGELATLQQRVDAAGRRIRTVAEDNRQRGDRAAVLLERVRDDVVQGRREIDRLTRAIAKEREEKAQILDLLQTLLAMAEQTGAPGERNELGHLEARVGRLRDQAVALGASVGAKASL